MKRNISSSVFCLLVLVAFSVQGCFGIGDNSNSGGSGAQNTKPITKNGGQQVSVNQTQNLFGGKIYFTIGRNIWVYDGKGNTQQLTNGLDARDPAVSPNGKTLVFIVRFKDFANLEFMPTAGGPHHTLITGNGNYYNDGGFIKSSYYWIGQPTWSSDGSRLLFLSDVQKENWYGIGGYFNNAPFLDLQIFSAPYKSQPLKSNPDLQVAAYASFGDGGDRDPAYRPGHPGEIMYTHYAYDASGTQQVIQLYLADSTMIVTHPSLYGNPLLDPGVPITPPSGQNLQPTFSADGNAIAYIRRESTNSMGLYIMPTPNGVTNDPGNAANQQKALQPYQKSSHILSGQFIGQPLWSPDGKQIVYISYNNGTFDIWLANISLNPTTGVYSIKGSPVQLTTGGVDGDSRPFWTA